MPKVGGGNKPRKLHTVKAQPPPKSAPAKDVSNAELKAAIDDLKWELQNLNSNLGKLYDQLRKHGIEREIPDDDVPF